MIIWEDDLGLQKHLLGLQKHLLSIQPPMAPMPLGPQTVVR